MTKHLTSTQLSMLRIAARDVTRFTEHLSDEVLNELYTAVAAELDDREACYAPLHSDDDEYDVAAQHSEVLAAFAECSMDTVWKRVPSAIEVRSVDKHLNMHPIVGTFPVEGGL